MNTLDAAVGKWFGILTHFGIDQSYLKNKHGPCPLCNGGKDRWRWDDKDGTGSYYCSQCGAGDGIRLLMAFKGWDFKEAANNIDKVIGRIPAGEISKPSSTLDNADRLKRISRGLTTVSGTNPVRLYLNSRGLRPTKNIRHHANLFYYDEKKGTQSYHGMICLFLTPEGKTSTFHITYLTGDGKKAPVESPKKLMPPVRKTSGGAIRLTDIYPHIGIAEGVETALAVIDLYKMPCWASANATMLEKFIPPDGIQKISIFGDNDKNYAGQKAAFSLANRLQSSFEVEVILPCEAGKDFADILEKQLSERENGHAG